MSTTGALAITTDAASVLSELRRAFQAVLAGISTDVSRPRDLQLLLNLDYKLCWQAFNITRTEDPLAISQFVPGMTSVNKLLAAARERGVADHLLADVDRAMKAFRRVVAAHSDDRRGFDSMVASISGGDGAELIAMQHRRDAFRSESQIWGAQVKTYLLQMIVRKAENGEGIDRCFVSSKYGLRCLRPGVMPIIHGHRDTASGHVPMDQVHPLDAAAALKFGASVLPRFCSQPVPNFKTRQHSNGYTYTMLAADEIGRKGAVNLVFGGVTRNVSAERDESGSPALLCGAAIIAPTQLAVVELFVHRSSFHELNPQPAVHSTASGAELGASDPMSQQFEIYEKVERLGSAANAPVADEAPSYHRQLEYVFSKLRWHANEFDLFRLRLAYPILHTRLRIVCRLGDPLINA